MSPYQRAIALMNAGSPELEIPTGLMALYMDFHVFLVHDVAYSAILYLDFSKISRGCQKSSRVPLQAALKCKLVFFSYASS